MTNIPNSWATVPIADVLAVNQNGKPFQQGWSPQCESHPASAEKWGVLKTTAIQPGAFWEYQNKELPEGIEPRPHIEVQAGDLLMTCAGPRNRCGVVCLVERTRPKLMISGKMYRFRPNPEVMDSRFLTYFIQSRTAQVSIDGMKTGISDSGLNLTHARFSSLAVPVAPRSEQTRIVEKIEELFSEIDNGIENLKAAREQLKLYRQSILKHAFAGHLTSTYRRAQGDLLSDASEIMRQLQSARHEAYESSLRHWGKQPLSSRAQRPRRAVVTGLSSDDLAELGSLPQNWEWRSLSELAGHIVDGTHKTPRYTSEGIPFISAKDVYGFRLHFDDTKFISGDEHQELSKRCRVQKGNVLITKSGTIGRVAVVETDAEFSLFESVANVPILDAMNPRFVCLAAYFIIETFFGRKNQKGVAVRHLHLEDIRKLPIPVTARSEQDEIARTIDNLFSQIDHFELSIDRALTQSDALRQSVLKHAFSGRLVAQDPANEPASELLERIRAGREEGGTGKRRNNKNGKKESA